ncbi:uncharacterized protein LOC142167217 [Nicotiana tabacum]|uniref:Uncharacterized protein LOC142167217 n=1 Tax=Nicotiana tabacum TaxID=4097 RepID=A0AC58SET8_TOBAC
MGSSLFWFDNWKGLGALYFLVPLEFGVDKTIHNVYDVMDDSAWNADKIPEILPEEFAEHILLHMKPPVVHDVLDKPQWILETRGEFSVKSTWEYLRRRNEPANAYKKIWVKGLPFRIAFFMFKVWRDKLPLDDFFRIVGYLMASKCWSCAEPKEETGQHLFFTSYAANRVWKYFLGHAGFALDGITFHQVVTKCWTTDVIRRLQPILQALPAVIVWKLWKRRNNYKYRDAESIIRVIYQVSTTMQSLVRVRKSGLQNVSHKWPELLNMMEAYIPKLKVTKGNVIYGCGKEVQEGTNTKAEAKAILEALRFCVENAYVLIELHTDLMMLKNVITGEWSVPWAITA